MPPSWGKFPVVLHGIPYIMVPAVVATLAGLWGNLILFIPCCVLTLFTLSFFRNPHRTIPGGDGVIVSPADGTVVSVDHEATAPIRGDGALRISIFMSVFNVHVNRVPIDSTVREIRYQKGRFLPAMKESASETNEQNMLHLQGSTDVDVVLVQVAGIVARRIVCYAERGSLVHRGDIFGAILFGSRVDVYLPPAVQVKVRTGDKVRGGETVLGVID